MAPLRIGLELSVTAFSDAGSARYSRSLRQALSRLAPANMEIVPLTLPIAASLPAAGPARRALVAAWEWVYVRHWLPRRVRAAKLDVLHLTESLPLGSFGHSYWPASTRVVVSVHDLFPLTHPEWFGPRRAERAATRLRASIGLAQRVLASSAFTAGELQRVLNYAPGQIATVHLGHEPFSASSDDSALADTRYWLAVGTLEPRKNLDAVVRAYQLLREAQAPVPELWIVGRAGWGRVDLEARVRQAGLVNCVRVLGRVSDRDLAALYRGASALVFPSLGEGFGFPPLEAMSAGCPVIASPTGSLPEVCGQAAVWVDPYQPEQIAAAMRLLIDDPGTADALRRAGLVRAAGFSWARCAERTVAVYRQMAEGEP